MKTLKIMLISFIFISITSIAIAGIIMMSGFSHCSSVIYFGYYGSAQEGLGDGEYIDTMAPFSNIVTVSTDSTNATTRGNGDVTKIQAAAAKGMKSLLFIDHLIYDIVFSGSTLMSISLNADYATRWSTYSGIINSEMSDVMGFYHLDEPFWNGYQADTQVSEEDMTTMLETVNTMIKTTFPTTNIVCAFAYTSMNENYNTAYTASRNNDFAIPDDYDYVGVIYYYPVMHHDDNDIPEWQAEYENYLAFLKTKIGSENIMMIPGAYYHYGVSVPESELAAVGRIFLNLAKADSDIKMIMPFLYTTVTEALVGIEDLSTVDAAYQIIGKEIVNCSD